GGFDRPPAGHRFPTSLWRARDRVGSQFSVEFGEPLPSGDYEVWVGLYESASVGALRLPVTAPGNVQTGDGQVQIAVLRAAS
ncbi:MAG: hypothetical protein ACK47M_15345, partial [Caldilinea sp.]